ncbi:hypothetical protein HWI79_2516 [Cryptosporidium felis]|nr:hypothetical protein HWI79_2516 [Cryptosporidium felis]
MPSRNELFCTIACLILLLIQSQLGLMRCESENGKKDLQGKIISAGERGDLGEELEALNSNDVVVEGKLELIPFSTLIPKSDKGIKEADGLHTESDDEDSEESELVFTENDYTPPEQSSGNERPPGARRGRSRRRHFKNRRGERRNKTRISDSDSSDSDATTGSETFVSSEDSKSSVNTGKSSLTEPEEERPPIPIIPEEEQAVNERDVDQILQLMHDQANSEARRVIKEKRERKLKELENQEAIMDKLFSVVSSMQKGTPLKSEFVYGRVKNYNYGDLRDAEDDLYQEEYSNLVKSTDVAAKNKVESYKKRSLMHEIRMANSAVKFFSGPTNKVSSPLLELSTRGSAPNLGKLGSPEKRKAGVEIGIQTKVPTGVGIDVGTETETGIGSQTPGLNLGQAGVKGKSEQAVLEGKSTSFKDFATQTTPESSPLFEPAITPELKSSESVDLSPGSKKRGELVTSELIEQDKLKEETLGVGTGPIDDQKQSIVENLQLPTTNQVSGKFVSEDPISRLSSDLTKLQANFALNLKSRTALNNIGRLRPLSSYTEDDFNIRTSRNTDSMLVRGYAAVGRLRKSKEEKVSSSSRANPLASVATVGRLRTPTKTTTTDRMRQKKETDDAQNYDYEAAGNFLGLEVEKRALKEKEIQGELERQIWDPRSVPEFVPSLAKYHVNKETKFLGDVSPPSNRNQAFKRGMLASLQTTPVLGQEGLLGPVVEVPKKIEGKKRVIRRRANQYN